MQLTTQLSLAAAMIVVSQATAIAAAERPTEFLEPTALERARFALDAARLNRVAEVMVAEANGKNVRDALEKAKEERAITVLSQSSAATAHERLVSSQVADVLRQLQFLQTQRELAEDDPTADKDRRKKLASIKEVKEYRDAQKHLLDVATKRQEAIDQSKSRGKDIRSEFEVAMERFSVTLEKNAEYATAVKQLKDEETRHSNAEYQTGLFTHAPSVALRVAVLRYQMQNRRVWP